MTQKSKPAPKTKPAATTPEKMGKTELMTELSNRSGLSKSAAGEAITHTLDVIVETLKSGKSVSLPGLGTLSVAATSERQGVKPGTGEKITIPAGKKVKFKVASTLKTGL